MAKKYNYFSTTFLAFKRAFKDCPFIVSFKLLILLTEIPSQLIGLFLLEEITNKAYDFINGVETSFLPVIHNIILFSLILFVFAILNAISYVLQQKLDCKLRYLYLQRLNKKLSNLPLEYYETQEIDNKIQLVKNFGAYIYPRVSLYSWLDIFYCFISIGIFIFITTRLPWWVVLIFIICCIIYIILGVYFGKKLYNKYDELELTRQRRNYLYFLTQSKETHQDSLMNRLTIPIIKKWRKLNDNYNNEAIKADLVSSKFEVIPNLFYALICLFVLYFVITEIVNGNQEIGFFTIVMTNIISFGNMLHNLSFDYQFDIRDNQIYRSYLEIMDLDEEKPNSNEQLSSSFNIEFEDVTYIYPQSEHKALNSFNLKIHENEIIAIVGYNGSGKTTFVNLLTELTKNYQGNIIVNGKNINNEMGILKNSISCIFQDFIQYSFTIKENICLGNINKTFKDEEIEQILNKVGLLDFVNTLPNGINTMLGQIEQGIDLSKGQWQRLAIARLLANDDSKIWILDEPTSFLDPMGEIEIYDLIKSLCKDKTILFISHRLGFSRQCQRILVFKDGKIIEDDEPDKLMNRNSLYKEMYETQKKWYE